jgi:hypothetical protein
MKVITLLFVILSTLFAKQLKDIDNS